MGSAFGSEQPETPKAKAAAAAPKPPPPLAQQLEDKPVLLWTPQDVADFFSLNGLASPFKGQLLAVLDSLQFDGECLLELGWPHVETILPPVISGKTPDGEELVIDGKIIPSNLEAMKKAVEALLADEADAKAKSIATETDVVANPKKPHALDPYEDLPDASKDPVATIDFYHKKTWNTTAGGARTLDRNWANQPKVYRRWLGSKVVRLMPGGLIPALAKLSWQNLWLNNTQHQPLVADTLSDILFYSLSCSGTKDAYSSPALYAPQLLGYLLLPSTTQLLKTSDTPTGTGGLFHYCPKFHGLELRLSLSDRQYDKILKCFGLDGSGGFLIALSYIDWRESWKYGERAFRYSQLDIGHCVQALVMALQMAGWSSSVVNNATCFNLADDEAVHTLLGLDDIKGDQAKGEMEQAAVVLAVWPRTGQEPDFAMAPGLTKASLLKILKSAKHEGNPNHLSYIHHSWPIIASVDQATKNTGKVAKAEMAELPAAKKIPKFVISCGAALVGNCLRIRRSAHDFAPAEKLTAADFFSLLAKTIPSVAGSVWAAVAPWSTQVFIGIAVTHVVGLTPGYYLLDRTATSRKYLKKLLKSPEDEPFLWEKPKGCPEELPLYFLQPAEIATIEAFMKQASCHQELAKTAAFSMVMFSPLKKILSTQPTHVYRQIHWEAGFVGQLLYIASTAHGYKACGMGCFLDDIDLQPFGLANNPEVVSLYHFAVGCGWTNEEERYKPYNYEKSFGEMALDALYA